MSKQLFWEVLGFSSTRTPLACFISAGLWLLPGFTAVYYSGNWFIACFSFWACGFNLGAAGNGGLKPDSL